MTKSPLYAQLLHDIGDISGYKAIEPKLLGDLGFALTAERIQVLDENGDLVNSIVEVRDEDQPYRDVGFCYIHNPRTKDGYVLAKPFRRYRDLLAAS